MFQWLLSTNEYLYKIKYWGLTSTSAHIIAIIMFVLMSTAVVLGIMNENDVCYELKPPNYMNSLIPYDHNNELIYLRYTMARYRYICCNIESMIVVALFIGVQYMLTQLLIIYGAAVNKQRMRDMECNLNQH